ncbi:unnamed protein product [Agarophyton chilense]
MRTFTHFRVFIQRLDGQIEPFHFPLLCVEDPPTLDDFRARLEQSALGDVEKDIFFPNWTKSLHVVQSELLSKNNVPSWQTIEQHKQTVDSADKLRCILDNEESSPGTTAIVVQQCRSKRYSRRKDDGASSCNSDAIGSAPASPRHSLPPLPQRYRKPLSASNYKQDKRMNNKLTSSNRHFNNNVTYGMAVNCVPERFDNHTMLYVEQPQAYFTAMGLMTAPAATTVYQPCYTYAPFNMPAYNYMGAASFITPYQPFYTY